ncbi:MAG: protein kinase [Oscillospiraceae bacterium]|nr:protein kinase [Oscillospiraceae bacterium]
MVLHGYTYDETQWKALGGNGQCVKAEKGGKQYFIKRLNKPKYPESDNFSGDFKKAKIAECDAWLKRRKAIAAALPGTGSGNIVKPVEYFREGPCFYEITHLVNVTSIPYTDIWKAPMQSRARMMMTIAMSLAEIHKAGIVHGDLDPGNILISKSAAGHLITKIIDFTDAFFEADPPDSIMSKDAWWSPEVALYSKAHGQSPNPYREYISCKADVFSLGLIFHQYCTRDGSFPGHRGDYPWQSFAGGGSLTIDPAIEPEFRALIGSMLNVEPENRPTMEEVHKTLRQIALGGTAPEDPPSHSGQESETGSDPPKKGPTGGPGIVPGPNRTRSGATVASARLHERNPKKVELTYGDGNTQIMDLALALAQGLVKKN